MFLVEIENNIIHLLQVETDLRRAISRGEFEVFYQPIVNLEKPRLSPHPRPPTQTRPIESRNGQNREVLGGVHLPFGGGARTDRLTLPVICRGGSKLEANKRHERSDL